MKESMIPSDFRIGDQRIRFLDLHRQFAITPYGKVLQENTRYTPYQPKDVSNEAWEQCLGPDVNNLSHRQLSLGLTRHFLAYSQNPPIEWNGPVPEEARFSEEEQQALLTTAVVHDWAEAVIGDIPYPDKTGSDEKREMVILRQLLNEQLGPFASQEDCQSVADSVVSILSDRASKLGKAFNAIERVGYVRTAVRGLQQSVKTVGQLSDNLEQMGLRVATYHTPQLVEYARSFPPVHAFLHRQKDTLTGAFQKAVEKGIVIAEDNPTALIQAKNVWEHEFLGQQSAEREILLLQTD